MPDTQPADYSTHGRAKVNSFFHKIKIFNKNSFDKLPKFVFNQEKLFVADCAPDKLHKNEKKIISLIFLSNSISLQINPIRMKNQTKRIEKNNSISINPSNLKKNNKKQSKKIEKKSKKMIHLLRAFIAKSWIMSNKNVQIKKKKIHWTKLGKKRCLRDRLICRWRQANS